jgi:hypothetical protein
MGAKDSRDPLRRQRSLRDSPVNITDTIDSARRSFEIAGRGCLLRIGEDEPRYATVAEIGSAESTSLAQL